MLQAGNGGRLPEALLLQRVGHRLHRRAECGLPGRRLLLPLALGHTGVAEHA
jgi:hypothetical protein